ncbi:MAG: hypothetical protein KAY37_03350 [Phycisphaerae bacterium]|nr:hypothetical protein [Phycisphaerae bacterium]
MLVLLAKFASPEIQGQYLLAIAVATPVIMFFGLQLRGALVADAGNQFTVGSYLTLRAALMVPAALVLVGYLIWKALAEHNFAYLLILGGLFAARIAWSVAEVGWGTFQRRERLDLLAVTNVLRGLALLLPFALLLPLLAHFGENNTQQPANGVAAAVLLGAVGFVVIYYLFDRPRVWDQRYWKLSWNWRSVRALAMQTFPLGLVILAITLCDSIPRIIIESQPDGKAQLGYFGSLAYITLAGNLIIIQAANAAANRLSLYYQRDSRAFLRLGLRLVGLALGVGAVVLIVALLFGEWILGVLYRPDYAQFATEFQIIVGAHCLALLTNLFGATTTQMRLFWVQVPVQVITLAATVIAAVLLIPGDTPVRGAAYTAMVRAVVQFVLYASCVGLGVVFRKRILRGNTARAEARGSSGHRAG